MIENLIKFAEVLVVWGFWIMVYGLATMVVGAIILAVFKEPIRGLIRGER